MLRQSSLIQLERKSGTWGFGTNLCVLYIVKDTGRILPTFVLFALDRHLTTGTAMSVRVCASRAVSHSFNCNALNTLKKDNKCREDNRDSDSDYNNDDRRLTVPG